MRAAPLTPPPSYDNLFPRGFALSPTFPPMECSVKAAFLSGIKLGSSGLKAELQQDLQRVDALIRSSLSSDIPFITNLNETILAPKGKRLRPALLILAAGTPGRSTQSVLLASAVVEMIHLATLLHDDVVDGSTLRRGNETLNARNGDSAAILMGDFIYSRAITMLVDAELTQVLGLLAWTVHRMSVGELLQLELSQRPILDEAAYLRVIHEKTANLIQSTCESGAVLGGGEEAQRVAFREFGNKIGMAFQMIDDVLDYVADESTLGKPVGSDLLEGKQTLPLLKAYAAASPATKAEILTCLGDVAEHKDRLIALVKEEGGVEAAIALARRYGEEARQALGRLPSSIYNEALDATVDFILDRRF
jgi:octaprenyl-diphosphate synthase